ncbi:25802_t:CDS:10 [Gigaspora rosea]|nr:25802_t:CDS:10 [Gigaspora rosea]
MDDARIPLDQNKKTRPFNPILVTTGVGKKKNYKDMNKKQTSLIKEITNKIEKISKRQGFEKNRVFSNLIDEKKEYLRSCWAMSVMFLIKESYKDFRNQMLDVDALIKTAQEELDHISFLQTHAIYVSLVQQKNIFITGDTSTGKTRVLKFIMAHYYLVFGTKIVVTISTGKAALELRSGDITGLQTKGSGIQMSLYQLHYGFFNESTSQYFEKCKYLEDDAIRLFAFKKFCNRYNDQWLKSIREMKESSNLRVKELVEKHLILEKIFMSQMQSEYEITVTFELPCHSNPKLFGGGCHVGLKYHELDVESGKRYQDHDMIVHLNDTSKKVFIEFLEMSEEDSEGHDVEVCHGGLARLYTKLLEPTREDQVVKKFYLNYVSINIPTRPSTIPYNREFFDLPVDLNNMEYKLKQEKLYSDDFSMLKECYHMITENKNGGGIGIDITDIRLSGNYIKGSGGISSGVGMMLCVFNEMMIYIDQSCNKCRGAMMEIKSEKPGIDHNPKSVHRDYGTIKWHIRLNRLGFWSIPVTGRSTGHTIQPLNAACDLNRRIFATIYYAALEESCDLAMGIDLDKQLDWASLRDRIKKFSIRNLLLVGPMPTASTSQCVKMGFSEGLFPDESNITLRETTRKSFIYIERELAKMLIERDLWSKGLIRQIQENRGSIQSIELFSDDMRQSMNNYVSSDNPDVMIKRLFNSHLMAWNEFSKEYDAKHAKKNHKQFGFIFTFVYDRQINKFIFESHENNNLQYQLLVSPIGDHTPLTLNGKKIEKAIKTSDGFDISIEVDLGTLCAADTDGTHEIDTFMVDNLMSSHNQHRLDIHVLLVDSDQAFEIALGRRAYTLCEQEVYHKTYDLYKSFSQSEYPCCAVEHWSTDQPCSNLLRESEM